MRHPNLFALVTGAVLASASGAYAQTTPPASIGVGPQYDTSHVYVAPKDVDAFVKSFLATFGGASTRQLVLTVTPTPSSTTSQALQTSVGSVSVFGFTTPIPFPFGAERNGYLVTDMPAAIKLARQSGADVIVAPFHDPIGMDAVLQWPGGVNMQLYWHTVAPHYQPLVHIPENRVYVSPDRADTFIQSFLAFSQGQVLADESKAAGADIGEPTNTFRRVRINSTFGRMCVLVTDGQLPFPYGRETTGYEVDDLPTTLANAAASGASVLVPAYALEGRRAAIVQFPGGYIAEIHQLEAKK